MFTQSFTHHTRFGFALIMAVLIGLPAASALADKSDNNGKSDQGKHSARSAQTQTPRSNSQAGQSDKGRAYQSNDQATNRQDSGSRWNSGSRPATNSGKSSTYQPLDNRRTATAPDTNYTRPGNQRDNNRTATAPDTNYGRNYNPGPNVGKRSGDVSINTRINVNNRDQANRPKGYTPPTYRGGQYYYSTRPSNTGYRYGHWVFNNYDPAFNRRSAYFYFGFFPYMETVRIHIAPYLTISYVKRTTGNYRNGYYLSSNTELDYALSDIRDAWLNGRADLIGRHISSYQTIAVLLDGSYDYSLDASDYNDMTADAIDKIQTVSFTWQETRERANGDFTAFGKHVYRDDSGRTKTVYVSYTLRRDGGDYTIVEVGSSDRPLY